MTSTQFLKAIKKIIYAFDKKVPLDNNLSGKREMF